MILWSFWPLAPRTHLTYLMVPGSSTSQSTFLSVPRSRSRRAAQVTSSSSASAGQVVVVLRFRRSRHSHKYWNTIYARFSTALLGLSNAFVPCICRGQRALWVVFEREKWALEMSKLKQNLRLLPPKTMTHAKCYFLS